MPPDVLKAEKTLLVLRGATIPDSESRRHFRMHAWIAATPRRPIATIVQVLWLDYPFHRDPQNPARL